MKIVVIGSKGFIGAHTIAHFRKLGHDTYGCDVVVDYNDPNYFQVDATNASYKEIFSAQKFEVCINCSGAASVPDSFVHPWRDFHLNVQNVYTILEAIRITTPTCKFINLSSAAVYGNPDVLPISESKETKPLSPYGWHKHYTEMVCAEFYSYFNIPTCSVRIFSAYGPGLTKQLFWDLFNKFKTLRKIELMGTGRESRDFIFIEDIVLGLETIINAGDFSSSIYNLASGKETTIKEAVETFALCFEEPVEVSFNNQVRKGDPLNWRADVSRLEELGFKPKVTLREGLKSYCEWLRKEKK